MALPANLPSFGCQHLNKDIITKIDDFRRSPKNSFDPDYIQYTCLACPTTASFPNLDKHFEKTKHEFAISQRSIYCGKCKDLVYEPSILFRGINGKKRKLAQLTEEEETYLSQNTTQKPCGREGVRGLFNLGETCYMNAVLQMMVHNPLLSSYFLGMGHPLHTCPISKEPEKKNDDDNSDEEMNGDDKEQKTCVACGMTELFSDSSLVDQTIPAHAVNLLFASWKHIPHMSGKGQQDAQEWFMIIVDKLHEAVTNPQVQAANSHSHYSNSVNGISSAKQKHCQCFFHKVFYGRFYSDVSCDTCHNITTSEEEYSSLSLDFKKQVKRKKKEANSAAAASKDNETSSSKSKSSLAANSAPVIPNLYDCLKSYTAPEPLTAESYTCPSCKTSRAATKRLRIRKLPAILCVHVKRFGMKKIGGVASGVAEKYEGKLDYPLSLDMGPYCTGADKVKNRGRHIYDLDCVVVHHGEHSHTGHYFAFCRIGGSMVGACTDMTGTGAGVHSTTNGSSSNAAGATPPGSGYQGMPGGKWFRFDDEIVSATTTEDVLRQEAYLLFYGLRDIGGGSSGGGDGGANNSNAGA